MKCNKEFDVSRFTMYFRTGPFTIRCTSEKGHDGPHHYENVEYDWEILWHCNDYKNCKNCYLLRAKGMRDCFNKMKEEGIIPVCEGFKPKGNK